MRSELWVVGQNQEDASFVQMIQVGCTLIGSSVSDQGSSQIMTYGGTISNQGVAVTSQPGQVVTLSRAHGGFVDTSINALAGHVQQTSAIQVK